MKWFIPFLFAGSVYAQAYQDTLKCTLEEVEVVSIKAVPIEFFHDPEKQLTLIPGVMSSFKYLAENTIDNVPSQFTGMYYDDTPIPILGSKTEFQGSISAINPFIADIELLQENYDNSRDHIGGVKSIAPKKLSLEARASVDLIDRKASGSIDIARIAFREASVAWFLKNNVEGLEYLPRDLDIQFYSSLDNTELFVLGNVSKQNYKNISQKTGHTFVALKHTIPVNDDLLKIAVASEYENTRSERNQLLQNFTVNAEFGDKKKNIGALAYILKYDTIDRQIFKLYGKYNMVFNELIVKPSASVSYLHKPALSGNLILGLLNPDIEVAAGHYETYLIDHNSILGQGHYDKKTINPNKSNHYSIRLRKDFDGIKTELSVFRKEFSVEYLNEGYSGGHSQGFRAQVFIPQLNTVITGYLSNSEINDHPIGGAIDNQLQILTKIPTLFIDFQPQLNFGSGYHYKHKLTQEYKEMPTAYSVDLRLSKDIGNFNLAIDFYNIIGHSIIAHFIENDEYQFKTTPVWGNITVQVKF
jgi:hypothetical protein